MGGPIHSPRTVDIAWSAIVFVQRITLLRRRCPGRPLSLLTRETKGHGMKGEGGAQEMTFIIVEDRRVCVVVV